MILLIEIIIGLILFTLIVVPSLLKDPLCMIGDYPPEIRRRCAELGLIENRKNRFSKKEIARKCISMIVLSTVLALIICKINGAETFANGFIQSYIIWLAVTWYDAIVLDCLWFCHSKRVRISGTENMSEHRDYLFHIMQSCIGSLLGLPVCLIVGLFVMLFS